MPRASPPKRRSMQECREVVDLLREYLEGGLTAEEARRLEGHLANCDACAGFLQSLRTVRAGAGALRADAVPEECRRALRDFLSTARKRRR
jgi:anti-sigma factor RsiW